MASMRHLDPFLASLLFACSSTQPATTSSATLPPAQESELDAGASDEAASAEPDATAIKPAGPVCVIKREKTSEACAEDCDARLILPGGGYWCSFQCESDGDCGDPALSCPAEIGACMPRCTGNAACTSSGFERCNADAGACDTL